MRVLVSDTSVIIDLDRGRMLERAFSLPYELCVPDLLFARELDGSFGQRLLSLGMVIAELDSVEVSTATTLGRRDGTLSMADTFAFALAKHRSWMLLTGDASLRRAAEAEDVEVHGTLWVFDELEGRQICDCNELEQGLSRTSQHPRCRLPKPEIAKRLTRYRNST